MIVVADKNSVYNPKKYPIPLVNRLEKHLLSVESILNKDMKFLVKVLKEWSLDLTKISERNAGIKTQQVLKELQPSDIFIGYTEDSIPSLVFKLISNLKKSNETNVLSDYSEIVIQQAKEYLIQCASSDGIIRLIKNHQFKQMNNNLNSKEIVDTYFKAQHHDNFKQFFNGLNADKNTSNFIQITTHSGLLTQCDLKPLQRNNLSIKLESLIAFDTQQQFVQVISEFFHPKDIVDDHVLIVQCDCGHFYEELINCAR